MFAKIVLDLWLELVSIISCNPSCKDDNEKFNKVPRKAFEIQYESITMLIILKTDSSNFFFSKVTCAFLLQENIWIIELNIFNPKKDNIVLIVDLLVDPEKRNL